MPINSHNGLSPRSLAYAGFAAFLLSSSAAVMPAFAQTTSWSSCATEGSICSFSGTKNVRFGANGTYAYKTATGSLRCSVSDFADPLPGVRKACDVASTTTAPVVESPFGPTPPSGSTSWTNCASEGSVCSFSGTKSVRFGASNTYAYKTATGSVRCSVNDFADPLPGVRKSCSFASTTTPAPAPTPTPAPAPAPAPSPAPASWTNCAAEGSVCTFSGTKNVRFGANGTYAFKTATGSIRCSVSDFPDPLPGIRKSCSYTSTSTPAPAPSPAPAPTPAPAPAPSAAAPFGQNAASC